MEKPLHKKLDLSVEVFFIKEADTFVAHCPSLNLTTQGSTYEDADKAFEEALQIFIDEVMEMGTLEDVLQECGWVKVQKQWVSPVVVGQAQKKFAIPA